MTIHNSPQLYSEGYHRKWGSVWRRNTGAKWALKLPSFFSGWAKLRQVKCSGKDSAEQECAEFSERSREAAIPEDWTEARKK